MSRPVPVAADSCCLFSLASFSNDLTGDVYHNCNRSVYRQLRRVTNTKGSFTSDTALMKLRFLLF